MTYKIGVADVSCEVYCRGEFSSPLNGITTPTDICLISIVRHSLHVCVIVKLSLTVVSRVQPCSIAYYYVEAKQCHKETFTVHSLTT